MYVIAYVLYLASLLVGFFTHGRAGRVLVGVGALALAVLVGLAVTVAVWDSVPEVLRTLTWALALPAGLCGGALLGGRAARQLTARDSRRPGLLLLGFTALAPLVGLSVFFAVLANS